MSQQENAKLADDLRAQEKILSEDFDYFALPSPCYVLENHKLESNLEILNNIQKQSGAKILLALKGYAFWRKFDKVREVLAGSSASGIYEATLGFEEIGGRESNKEVCVFSPAYKPSEINALLSIATHIIFNSFAQWQKYKPAIQSKNSQLAKLGLSPISVGLRLNPLFSEVEPEIYNPCAKYSRLGITPSEFEKGLKNLAKSSGENVDGVADSKECSVDFALEGIEGLHFHTHCEQGADALARTLEHIHRHFSSALKQMKWINLGGGHHITKKGYDTDLLISLIKDIKSKYNNIEVFLEPGEAVGWESGFLLGEVVDIVENEKKIAILDVSASAHMPDCLEMPYRPSVIKISRSQNHTNDNSDKKVLCESDKGECGTSTGKNGGKYAYRFGGPTCLAGDIIGDFSFDTPLEVGDRVAFLDMLHYTIVKNTTFNGVPLPSLGIIEISKSGKASEPSKECKFRLLKSFGYNDYKERN